MADGGVIRGATPDGHVIEWPREYGSLLADKPTTPVLLDLDGLPENLRRLVEAKGWRSVQDMLQSYVNLERLLGRKSLSVGD